jgi:N6-adenosine-specific RNA methylase IME4
VFRRVVREAEIEQERAERRKQTAQGGTVADLHALITSGFRAGVIAVDPPWPFEHYSDRAARATTEHYEVMTLDEIKALPVAQLAAADCALFMWATWPNMPVWREAIEAWGFTFSALAFDWVKLKPDGEGLHMGGGVGGTRANPEPRLLARRGSPLRLDAGVHSGIMTPVGAHSEKPDTRRSSSATKRTKSSLVPPLAVVRRSASKMASERIRPRSDPTGCILAPTPPSMRFVMNGVAGLKCAGLASVSALSRPSTARDASFGLAGIRASRGGRRLIPAREQVT